VDLIEWIALKRESLRQLGPLEIRNVTPALRDFTHAVSTRRGPLAVIFEWSRRTPEEGGLNPPSDIGAWATLADACSVSALAVGMDETVMEGRPEDLRAAAAGPLPVLARDLVLSREQVYLARLGGADAVHLMAGAVPASELKTFIDIAASTHMASAVEVRDEPEMAAALAAGARILVIPAFGAAEELDTTRVDALHARVPQNTVLIARGPFAVPSQLESVRAKVDAVWVAGPALKLKEPENSWRAFVENAENGTV
jgi:indole-3-glycerol phosphate synthase